MLRTRLIRGEDLHVARTLPSPHHHCRPRERIARMPADSAPRSRETAVDGEPRRARAGDDGSSPRDRRASTSAGDVELRQIVVERARVAGETCDDASFPSRSENDDASFASPLHTRGSEDDGGAQDDGGETRNASGELVIGERGEKRKPDDDDVDVHVCRICMDPIRPEDIVSFSRTDGLRDAPIPRDDDRDDCAPVAVHLGCACTGGYMHVSCASQFVAKRRSNRLTCEICLETMESLRSLRDRRVEARRRAGRARLAFLVLNGASAEDIRRERRRLGRRRGGGDEDEDEDDATFRRRVGDARADAFGWGSRNPCVWVLWILTRPLLAIAWVRVDPPDRPPLSARRSFIFYLATHSFPRDATRRLRSSPTETL